MHKELCSLYTSCLSLCPLSLATYQRIKPVRLPPSGGSQDSSSNYSVTLLIGDQPSICNTTERPLRAAYGSGLERPLDLPLRNYASLPRPRNKSVFKKFFSKKEWKKWHWQITVALILSLLTLFHVQSTDDWWKIFDRDVYLLHIYAWQSYLIQRDTISCLLFHHKSFICWVWKKMDVEARLSLRLFSQENIKQHFRRTTQ